MTTITRLVLLVFVVSLTSVPLFAQSKCLSPRTRRRCCAGSLQNVRFNKKLHDDLLQLALKTESIISREVENDLASDDLGKRLSESSRQNNARLCQMLKEFGWPTSALVGKDGMGSTAGLLPD
jgi:hypothetical protein